LSWSLLRYYHSISLERPRKLM